MKLATIVKSGAAVAALATLSACGSPPQKILVQHNYIGTDKSSKVMILDSGQTDPSTKRKLFHVFVRMCNVNADGTESGCKDTQVLDNVDPRSVF